jgi:TonB family protein
MDAGRFDSSYSPEGEVEEEDMSMSLPGWKKPASIALIALFLSGCAYYNTFYNAKRSFKEGEKAQKNAAPSARQNMGKGQYEDAIKKASKVLTFYPKSKWADDALFLIGRAYFNMGEYVKAKRKFEELEQSFPKSKFLGESHYFISLCQYNMGEKEEAVSSMSELLNSKKTDKKRKGQVSFWMAEVKFENNEYDDAITYYKKTLKEFDPDTLAALTRFRIAECFWGKKDYLTAKTAYADVEKSNPSTDLSFDSRFKEGECSYLLGEYNKGMKIFWDLSENKKFSSKLPEIKLKIAEGYYHTDELSLAMQGYTEITETYPRTEASAQAYYQLGDIYKDRFGDLAEAQSMYESCKNENPSLPIAKEALTQSANISKIEQYQKELSEEATEKSSQTLFLLGELYLLQMDQPDSALDEYLTLAEKFPESEYAPKALYAAAWIWENVKNDTSEADKLYQRILEEYPQSEYKRPALEFLNVPPDSSDTLDPEGMYQEAEKSLFENDDVYSAMTLYNSILEKFPHSTYAAKSLFAKAWVYENVFHPEDSTAIHVYQEVIEEYPETKYAQEAKIKLGEAKRAEPVPVQQPVQTTIVSADSTDTTQTALADTTGPTIPRAPETPLVQGVFVYPEEERLSGIKGTVVLKILIAFDGTVKEAVVVNSLGNLWIDEAAKQAALKTTFDTQKMDPTQLGGWFLYPVEVKPPEQSGDHTDQTPTH